MGENFPKFPDFVKTLCISYNEISTIDKALPKLDDLYTQDKIEIIILIHG